MKDSQDGRPLLRAGAAQVDITPPMGTQIAGDIGRHRPAEWIMDPLYAKALVLECGGRKVCVLSMDLLALCREWADEIRRRAQAEFGLAPEAVVCHVTQTHAAPSLGHLMVSEQCRLVPPGYEWLRGGDDRYHPMAVERVLEAIRQANSRLEPVCVSLGRGMDGRVAFNRRFVMRDGTAEMNPGSRLTDVLYREGPIDPEVGVAAFTNDSLRTVAVLLHHTCHPVHGYPQRYITAGWPGAWAEEMRAMLGRDTVGLVINGCCGNVHHADILNPEHVDDFRRSGRMLADTARKALTASRAQDVTRLEARSRRFLIPYRKLDPAQLTAARDLLRQHPEPIWKDDTRTAAHWDWYYALSRCDLAEVIERTPGFEYEVQVVRIGELALVVLMGEPFVEGQLRLKLESPQRFTFVAHMSNGYVGYIPTPHAIARGGYETRVMWGSKLAPEALDRVVDEAVRLVKEVFADGSATGGVAK